MSGLLGRELVIKRRYFSLISLVLLVYELNCVFFSVSYFLTKYLPSILKEILKIKSFDPIAENRKNIEIDQFRSYDTSVSNKVNSLYT